MENIFLQTSIKISSKQSSSDQFPPPVVVMRRPTAEFSSKPETACETVLGFIFLLSFLVFGTCLVVASHPEMLISSSSIASLR